MIRDVEQQSRALADPHTGVPLLKNIPFLGYFFKSESKSSSRKEILIFITPKILNDVLLDQ